VQAVRDVAVHEDFAGLAVADGGLGDAGVCASNPQDLGALACRERLEEVGVPLRRLLGVGAVAGDDSGERVCQVRVWSAWEEMDGRMAGQAWDNWGIAAPRGWAIAHLTAGTAVKKLRGLEGAGAVSPGEEALNDGALGWRPAHLAR
jgi:hypothetical protein